MDLQVSDEIVLRPRTHDNAAEFFAVIDANRTYLRQWLPWLDATRKIEDVLDFTDRMNAEEEAGTEFGRLIYHRDAVVGIVSINAINPVNRDGSLGYWIAERSQGFGIITESARATIKHAFNGLALNRISAGAAVDNTRSRAVLKRLGFIQYGTSPEAQWLYDHFVDHAVYALLASAYLAGEFSGRMTRPTTRPALPRENP